MYDELLILFLQRTLHENSYVNSIFRITTTFLRTTKNLKMFTVINTTKVVAVEMLNIDTTRARFKEISGKTTTNTHYK